MEVKKVMPEERHYSSVKGCPFKAGDYITFVGNEPTDSWYHQKVEVLWFEEGTKGSWLAIGRVATGEEEETGYQKEWENRDIRKWTPETEAIWKLRR